MGAKIRALRNTIAKKEPVDSTTLDRNLKRDFDAGWVFPVSNVSDAPNNHFKVNLGFESGVWYFYQPHVQVYDVVPARGTLAEKVVACCMERDYPLQRGAGEINIVGIEGIDLDGTFNSDTADGWNDVVGVLTFDRGQPKFERMYKATTEPGHYYTRNPPVREGVARLDTGYHHKLWQVGLHRGYEALTQGGNIARLVRDINRNNRRDDRVSSERSRGINLHTTKTTNWRGSASASSIGQWSAGCVVIYDPDEFLELMKLVKSSAQYKRSAQFDFDFILLWSRWLETSPAPARAARVVDGNGKVDSKDLDVLARTLWGEARSESDLGKAAVAWVVRNRTQKSPKYGWSASIQKVCQQPFQFSCWNKNDPNRNKLLAVAESDAQFKLCLEIADQVLRGAIPDPTGGADHYFANYINTPRWARGKSVVAEIGVHQFYKLV